MSPDPHSRLAPSRHESSPPTHTHHTPPHPTLPHHTSHTTRLTTAQHTTPHHTPHHTTHHITSLTTHHAPQHTRRPVHCAPACLTGEGPRPNYPRPSLVAGGAQLGRPHHTERRTYQSTAAPRASVPWLPRTIYPCPSPHASNLAPLTLTLIRMRRCGGDAYHALLRLEPRKE